ncbi:T7SS effector LXG polymorphic toxin [Streptococcus equinus]|uniref:T7SS effector LXG polymorphic toxin n=1 Tax=Streptococcus equinus TaxID=1335 RepID=UPI00237AF727|nr:T7SS effector LXG polymorphic toxin [Streptococcus equinus]
MKIKMSEVIEQRDSLKSSISQTKSQLSSAKKKLKSTANSEALKGDVKDAIDNKINNYQVPLLTNYVNSLDVIAQGYDNLISTFKSIVSENSDSAIIDTDVLQQMVDKFDSPLEQLKTSSDAINKAIDEVADIVALTKVTTDDAVSEFKGAKKVLTNTIKDMGIFNNTVFTSEVGDILDEQNTQISSLLDLGSSSYTSKKAKNFYKKTNFKTEVKEVKSVVNGKARKDHLKNELAKNLYDSKYSGYMMENVVMKNISYSDSIDLTNFVNNNRDSIVNDLSNDIFSTSVEQLGLGYQRIGGIVTVSEGIKGPAKNNSFVLVNLNGAGLSMVSHGKKIASTGNYIGKAFMGAGFVLGMYDDIENDGSSVGQAISHNAISTGIGWGAGSVTTAALTTFLVSNPVGWAAVGVAAAGIAVGTIASVGFEYLYENDKNVKNKVDQFGNTIDNVGNCFQGSLADLNNIGVHCENKV